MTFKLRALSSNKKDIYNVELFDVSGKIGVSCNCPANTFCKHIDSLFTGKTSNIFPEELNTAEEINTVVNLLISSGMADKYESLSAELDVIKAEYKERTQAVKHELNRLCVPTI
ncbi:hypothetical protein AB7282_08615 [Providencia huaxiensis]|uniref:hypothetical protein n=2 Tax=Providencia TaxID=586 RepID=UPI000EF0D8B1|nr:hypothetical protein [Providencia rettgeri]ELR5253328.1 hypothetical protein [Providencia rettgeri]ELR5281603.1 hypothetical protein [Providencia rettgeri]MDY0820750.1 hypothetical protein [Providencia rettgeri]HCI97201.1 hypothetical protein [Providencia sp.]